jgi:hypothetical protein
MLNVKQIAEQAASEFGLSLKDDPTAWPAGAATMPNEVVRQCNEAARENARSALSRALGKVSELIATDMDVAISEDGPLADLPAVLAQHVEGLDVDLSGVEKAEDWQGRVGALREALGMAVHGFPVAKLSPDSINAYIADDPRLAALAASLKHGAAVSIETSAAAVEAIENGNLKDEDIPAFLRRGAAAAEPAGDAWDDPATDEEAKLHEIHGPETADWDDEPAPAATPTRQRAAAAPSGPVPPLVGLAVAAGLTDTEMAAILGLSKSYYSLIRNGKRPWPGMKPDQAKALRKEISERYHALMAVAHALDEGAVLKPDGA